MRLLSVRQPVMDSPLASPLTYAYGAKTLGLLYERPA